MKSFLCLLFYPFLLSGEIRWRGDLQKPFSLTITLDSDQIHKDELLSFDVELRNPSSYHIDLESLAEQLAWSANPLSPFVKIAQKNIETHQNEAGEVESHIHALLHPLKEGKLHLSLLKVIFKPEIKEENPVEIMTPVFTVTVVSPAKATPLSFAPLIPMQPQFPLGLTEANQKLLWEDADQEGLKKAINQHSFPWTSIILALSIAAMGWMACLIKEQLPKRGSKPPPSLPPTVKANHSLRELHQQNFIGKELYQMHAAELSSILLTFQEENLNIKLKGMTTEEIEKLHLLPTPSLIFLKKLDPLKFAKKTFSKEESAELEKELQRLLS